MARAIDKLRQDGADRLKTIVPLSVRTRVVRMRLRFRIATARFRTQPDFLIIGAQRSGTSSLYKWLSRHPNVVGSLRKEVEYFSVDYTKGESWYRAHFPLTLRRRLAQTMGRPWQTFEATPDYLFDPRAPQRVAAMLPNVKLVVLLREPASRAVSHYHHSVRHHLEELDLETALQAEHDRLAPEWGLIDADPAYQALPFRRFSYVARSRYGEQLERWFARFPSERMLVMRSEDLFADPAASFRTIQTFLELPEWEPPEFRNYSYTNPLVGSYDPPEESVTDFLAGELEEPNQKLVEMLGTSFSWDRTTTS